MKGFDHIFCASQASTAVCSSRDQIGKCTITTTATAGGRAIDRHNPTTKDGRRSFSTPCSSSSLQTIDPKPVYHQLQKTQKPQGDSGNCREAKKEEKSRKQSEPERNSSSATSSLFKRLNNDGSFGRKSFSCTKPVAIGSSRYLLGEPENDAPGLPVGEKHDAESVTASKPDASLSSTLETIKPSSDQVVVVLRVSLHCRGCEGKVRKHLSRMQGVTSFNIDFAAKKVTVTGDVSPLEVLASISKVKNAQLWTNPPSSSSSSSTLSTRLSQGIKN